MIDMGPVSDSDEEAREDAREEDPSARETGGGGGDDDDDEYASYGGGDDDPHSPRSAAAPPEDEGTETRVDDDTEPIGETDAVCIRSLVCRAIDAVVARSAAPDPPERAPSPAADATDEESEEEAEEEEEEEVPVDAYYDDVDDDAPPISPVPAAFASMTAAARVVPEDRGRDPEAPTPTSDPAARNRPGRRRRPGGKRRPPLKIRAAASTRAPSTATRTTSSTRTRVRAWSPPSPRPSARRTRTWRRFGADRKIRRPRRLAFAGTPPRFPRTWVRTRGPYLPGE